MKVASFRADELPYPNVTVCYGKYFDKRWLAGRSTKMFIVKISDGSGSKKGRVNFLWLGSGRVGSAIYGFGLDSENFC